MSNGLPKQCPSCGGFSCTKPCSYGSSSKPEPLFTREQVVRDLMDNPELRIYKAYLGAQYRGGVCIDQTRVPTVEEVLELLK